MSNYNDSGYLPAAAGSPRVVGGVLKWYEGDTFQLQVRFDLTDQNGEAIPVEKGQTVRFVFRDRLGKMVYMAAFADAVDSCVTLQFTDEVTALFPKGSYTYDVIYQGPVRRTLAHNAPVLVE